jgi:Domain of unknown function (DUF1963)
MWETKAQGLEDLSNAIGDLLRARSIAGKLSYSEQSTISLRRLKDIKPVWTAKTEIFNSITSDRKGNLFGGMPFTSNEHTWPINNNGNPYYPLVQVNLSDVSATTRQRFGDGLMQVWLDLDHDSNLMHSMLKVIKPNELQFEMTNPSFQISESGLDEMWGWGGEGYTFSLNFKGFVCKDIYDFGGSDFNHFSNEELTAFNNIRSICEKNGYRSIGEADWFLGYPDEGGPAGGMFEDNLKNFIQFGGYEIFPLSGIGKVANIFYYDEGDDVEFLFEWGG